MRAELISTHNLSVSELAKIARVCTTPFTARPQSKDIESDTALCEKLYAKGHWSVFEHATMTFYIECTRACSLQLARHRHISRTEMSQRYVKLDSTADVFDMPEAILNGPPALRVAFHNALAALHNSYCVLLATGVKPEDARAILPESTRTRMFVTLNLRTMLELAEKRADNPAAQSEIRELVREMWRQLPIEITELFTDSLPFMALSEAKK